MSFVENLWENHRIWFWILLPVVAVIVLANALGGLHKIIAMFTYKKALKKDAELTTADREIELESAREEGRIEEIEHQIEERKAEDVPLDWHKNFKD